LPRFRNSKPHFYIMISWCLQRMRYSYAVQCISLPCTSVPASYHEAAQIQSNVLRLCEVCLSTGSAPTSCCVAYLVVAILRFRYTAPLVTWSRCSSVDRLHTGSAAEVCISCHLLTVPIQPFALLPWLMDYTPCYLPTQLQHCSVMDRNSFIWHRNKDFFNEPSIRGAKR
jgi:hypothetical protein